MSPQWGECDPPIAPPTRAAPAFSGSGTPGARGLGRKGNPLQLMPSRKGGCGKAQRPSAIRRCKSMFTTVHPLTAPVPPSSSPLRRTRGCRPRAPAVAAPPPGCRRGLVSAARPWPCSCSPAVALFLQPGHGGCHQPGVPCTGTSGGAVTSQGKAGEALLHWSRSPGQGRVGQGRAALLWQLPTEGSRDPTPPK